jgi:asparagine synthase (glutamine-hydrolysing)
MCGIVGIASRFAGIEPGLLAAACNSLRHRGPDDAGLWQSPDGRVGLAQRRLAIIDLSPSGHQPMTDASGQLWITFNGEIYNYLDLRCELAAHGHRFCTASDTEVVLGAYRTWGVDCLLHLNGMFAFGLYDSAARRLFLARDRAGEKPLFYWHTPGRLVFASELKALMADPTFPRRLNLEALDYYLAYGYVPGEMCILQGVRKLAQGQAMTYDLETDALRVWYYWRLLEPPSQVDVSADDLTAELEALLEDSVRRQLVADVPVGIMLSGGIDSSLVTAMAARVSSKPVKTFTISFPGHEAYDEGPYARLVAEYFGTQHTEMVAEPATVELLPELARQYDEPIADSSMVPMYLVARLIRQHATVALGGDGGDELFGGYLHYVWLQRHERARRALPDFLRRWIGLAAARVLPVGLRGRNHLIGFSADLSYSIAHVNIYFDHCSRRRLLAPVADYKAWPTAAPEAYRAGLCVPEYTLVRQATEADFRTTMGDNYLVKVDRASMLNALEVRAPWLDYRIIEFAFGRVPDTLRVMETERKILPRRLAQRLLPPALDLRRKQGFSLPLMRWFKGAWGAYVESVLREADPQLFDQRMIQSLITGQHRGYANTARLFALTMFELWRREYRVAVSN